ncbi:MAG: PQQ-dependent sugar dehydrogenase [Patescibacteria group bacterium]
MRTTFFAIGIPVFLTLGGCTAPAANPPSPSPPSEAAGAANKTGLPLTLPPGFTMQIVADRLPGARVLARDAGGNIWVSRPSEGTVSVLDAGDGTPQGTRAALRGLRRPHGLAFDASGGTLYVAEETRIIAVDADVPARRRTVSVLPPGGRHWTRSLAFGSDGRLYVSIGSTCDACVEADLRHGAVLSMNPDGSDVKTAAKGLRNAVFLSQGPDGRIWATEMGRDFLGDGLPPDEVNVVVEGAHYGWPFCYGKQVRDARFRPRETFDCSRTVPSHIDLPAHVAPLGLAFIPDTWPQDMRGDLLVALHGSWNSTQPVGYKIVRIPLDANGKQEGPMQDFVSGWLRPDGTVLGRPVDLLFGRDGTLYVTDDKRGVVYLVRPV